MLSNIIKNGSSRKYIFKDGKFSVEPTTNNFTNKSTYTSDGYLQTNDAFSGTLLQIDNLPSNVYLYVEMKGLKNCYDNGSYTPRFYGGISDYWLPSAEIGDGNGMLRKEVKFVFGFPIDGYFKIVKNIANNLSRYNIYRIWIEEVGGGN